MAERNQWIFVAPCGCPTGVMEGTEARDEGEALAEMYYDRNQMRAAKDRGIKVELISFQEYKDKYYDLMFDPCPH